MPDFVLVVFIPLSQFLKIEMRCVNLLLFALLAYIKVRIYFWFQQQQIQYILVTVIELK
jgi:hypothetical protein